MNELEYGKGEDTVIFGISQSPDDFVRNKVTIYAETHIPNSKILEKPELSEEVKKDLFKILARATILFESRGRTMGPENTPQDEPEDRNRLLGLLIRTWLAEGNEVILRNRRGEAVTLDLADGI